MSTPAPALVHPATGQPITPFPPARHGLCSSQVHPLESNPPSPATPPPPQPVAPAHINHPRYGSSEYDQHAPITPLESQARHATWAARRRQVYEALNTAGQSDRRRGAFADCGNTTYVYRSADGLELTRNCCHDRFCEACGRSRAAILQQAISGLLKDHFCRFLTLTLRADGLPLTDMLDRLYRDFSTLRRRAWWRDHVTGGVAVVEVKVGQNSGQWHAHIHAFIEGGYLDVRELSEEWHKVTGDSYIVDLREIGSKDKLAGYVAKYVCKPADASLYNDPDRLQELILALKGRRLFTTFGTWRGMPLKPVVQPHDDWKPLGSLDSIVDRAAAGDQPAFQLLVALTRQHPEILAAIEQLNYRITLPTTDLSDGP